MGDDAERRDALRALLEVDGDIPALVQALDSFRPVDVDPVITMTAKHVVGLLERFLAGELSSEDVGLWAEAMENRADVEIPEEGPDLSYVVALELATEGRSRPVTPERASQFIGMIERVTDPYSHVAAGTPLSQTEITAIRRTGEVYVYEDPDLRGGLEFLRPVMDDITKLVIWGEGGLRDLSLLPQFTALKSLATSAVKRPGVVDFTGLTGLESLGVAGGSPKVRKALLDASFPVLDDFAITGARADSLDPGYSFTPTTVSLWTARNLESLDPTLPWLAKVEDLEIHGARSFSCVGLRQLPSLKRLTLSSVTRICDVTEFHDTREPLLEKITIDNCRSVDDIDAFLRVRARAIWVYNDLMPIRKKDAAQIPPDLLHQWDLPPYLTGERFRH